MLKDLIDDLNFSTWLSIRILVHSLNLLYPLCVKLQELVDGVLIARFVKKLLCRGLRPQCKDALSQEFISGCLEELVVREGFTGILVLQNVMKHLDILRSEPNAIYEVPCVDEGFERGYPHKLGFAFENGLDCLWDSLSLVGFEPEFVSE